MDKTTKRLLKQYPELEYIKDKGIVKCQLGGHEMQCKAEIIESYVNGKKFKKLRDKNQHKLLEQLSFSKIHQGKLFCSLTNCYINCSSANIDRHTTGRRYQRALQQFKQGNLELYKEQQDDQGVADHDQQPASDSDIDQDVSFQDDDITYDQGDGNQESPDEYQHHNDEHQDDSDDGQGETKPEKSRIKQNRKRKVSHKLTSKHKSKKIRI